MDELFSCRNCIHNCGQALHVGQGAGYCLQHNSVIPDPGRTTCKYLHRKDLPYFVVDEGIREHAGEFAFHTGLVRLDTHKEIGTVRYSEKHAWETNQFDSLTHALAQYYKAERRWVFIQAFTAGTDGRRSLAHACLIRHYLNHCGTWVSSYRLVLGLLEEVDDTPHFSPKALLMEDRDTFEDIAKEALWDVIFTRLSTLQEYGWHAGLKELAWASDELNGSLAALDWSKLQPELAAFRERWIKTLVSHAKQHKAYFPSFDTMPDEDQEY
jgi:hypothetical protein